MCSSDLLREGALTGFGAPVHGWAPAARSFRHLRWWVFCILVLVITVHLGAKPLQRPAEAGPLTTQASWMAMRAAGYLLVTTAWVLLASALGRLRRANAEPVADVLSEPIPVNNAPKV